MSCSLRSPILLPSEQGLGEEGSREQLPLGYPSGMQVHRALTLLHRRHSLTTLAAIITEAPCPHCPWELPPRTGMTKGALQLP